MREQAQIILWEEPPPVSARGRNGAMAAARLSSRYDAMAAQLRERPGRSALVAELPDGKSSTLASRINSGAISSFRPAGDFAATTRLGEDGVTRIWAVYLGDGDA